MRVGVLEKNGIRDWYALEPSGVARRFKGSPFDSPSPSDSARFDDDVTTWEPSELRAPVRPSKIVCVGRNYAAHAKEMGGNVPSEPLLFLKPPSAIIGPNEAVILPPESKRVEHEAELGVVIAKRTHRIAREQAMSAVFGYTCVCDVTARDLQKSDGQWSRAKGFDTFCPTGPWIETDVDPSNLKVLGLVDGAVRQNGCTANMIFSVPTLVSYISHAFTLEPGDLIVTGTPEGVGPLVHGNSLTVRIDAIGELTVGVADWSRLASR
ncbi:MAG: fumarylacetoacetate hydrolase family protein [Polyangiaceae bacterium]|nr:fumarylacetoacetate hydrolase family protein [Polyangiaceae bacterium]